MVAVKGNEMGSLILGASGFIGRHLLSALVADGERVIATSRGAALAPLCDQVTHVCVDLETFDDWDALLKGVTTIYHLAWSTLPHTANFDPVGDARSNIGGSLRLLDSLKRKPGVRLIFASSGGTVYGRLQQIPVSEDHPTHPITAYGVSKRSVELYLDLYAELWDLNSVILRIGNPYGPLQDTDRSFGAVATFIRRALDREPITIYGDGSVVRDYIYISDLIAALTAAARRPTSSRVFNIGSGRGHSLNEIIAAIAPWAPHTLERRHEPARAFDVPISILNISRAQSELGWNPKISFEKGIASTIAAAKRQDSTIGGSSVTSHAKFR
jgi:UDP-glucose 4-epimerase